LGEKLHGHENVPPIWSTEQNRDVKPAVGADCALTWRILAGRRDGSLCCVLGWD